MKFIAIIDESDLKNDEKSKLLWQRSFTIKPIYKEMLVTKDGESIYLTEGHIDCFIDYEKKKILEDVLRKNPIVELMEEWKGEPNE